MSVRGGLDEGTAPRALKVCPEAHKQSTAMRHITKLRAKRKMACNIGGDDAEDRGRLARTRGRGGAGRTTFTVSSSFRSATLFGLSLREHFGYSLCTAADGPPSSIKFC